MSVATLLLAGLTVFPFVAPIPELKSRIVVAGLCGSLFAVSAWVTWRIFRSPFGGGTPSPEGTWVQRGSQELVERSAWAAEVRAELAVLLQRATRGGEDGAAVLDAGLERYPNDGLLLALKAHDQLRRGRPEIAEQMYDQGLAAAWASAAARAVLLAGKLQAVMRQGAEGRADQLVTDYLDSAASPIEKAGVMDLVVCDGLYREEAVVGEAQERWVRRLFALAPGVLTLKGTLGAILVERGQLEEAESLLRECGERSLALVDQGIAALYLGVIAMRRGEADTARRLLRRARALHPEPWLLRKVERTLQAHGGDG